jgi:hypothetical protein
MVGAEAQRGRTEGEKRRATACGGSLPRAPRGLSGACNPSASPSRRAPPHELEESLHAKGFVNSSCPSLRPCHDGRCRSAKAVGPSTCACPSGGLRTTRWQSRRERCAPRYSLACVRRACAQARTRFRVRLRGEPVRVPARAAPRAGRARLHREGWRRAGSGHAVAPHDC